MALSRQFWLNNRASLSFWSLSFWWIQYSSADVGVFCSSEDNEGVDLRPTGLVHNLFEHSIHTQAASPSWQQELEQRGDVLEQRKGGRPCDVLLRKRCCLDKLGAQDPINCQVHHPLSYICTNWFMSH